MKKLDVTWDGIPDSTGFLFSFAKSLACAVKRSPWPEYAEDIVATSGFAFRMWVSSDLCVSATSIWEFDRQKEWVENGGLTCEYVGRYWGQDEIEEARRLEATANIKRSIDSGIPAIAWDIGVPEWGLITGYDDDARQFATLDITGRSGTMPFDLLGKREIPILSVLTVTGTSGKPREEILRGTKKLAVTHLTGGEWCENAKGLDAYPALIAHVGERFNPDASWNLEYFLGTYGALKRYAWKYFEKAGESELAALYRDVHAAWQEAFDLKKSRDIGMPDVRARIAALLGSAHEKESRAAELMSRGA